MLTCSFILEECDPDHMITEYVFFYFVIVFFCFFYLQAHKTVCFKDSVHAGDWWKEITDTQEEKNEQNKKRFK